MEQLADWSMLYNRYIGEINTHRMHFYHGLSLFGSFVIFGLLVTRSIFTRETLQRRLARTQVELDALTVTEEEAQMSLVEAKEVFLFPALPLLYYALTVAGILWISLIFSLRISVFPLAIGGYLVFGLIVGFAVLLIFSLPAIERMVMPSHAFHIRLVSSGLGEGPRHANVWYVQMSKSRRVLFLIFGFFGFIAINGGVMGFATLTISESWEKPYVIRGKVSGSRNGVRGSRYITLKVEKARFLEASGLTGQVKIPKQFEIRTNRKIEKQRQKAKALMILITGEQGVSVIPARKK